MWHECIFIARPEDTYDQADGSYLKIVPALDITGRLNVALPSLQHLDDPGTILHAQPDLPDNILLYDRKGRRHHQLLDNRCHILAHAT